ncbi:unnamed protein product [Brachionus calyciflorus]|uniref:Apple domain-containing protein n=1 Tax=Brachionus calyciflorus TaxID=104777 RepID=A0A813M520_9BILA|nr:unnamed protein product [Brachionus calyciflorus]
MNFNKLSVIFTLVIFFENKYTTAADTPFCLKSDIKPIADPNTLPKLPSEFQTRVQATFKDVDKTVEFLLAYDYYDQKAEIITQEDIIHEQRIFYYDKNEYFLISNRRQCEVKKINETVDEFNFFGLVIDKDGLFNMKTANDLLHFNNDFPHKYVGREEYRGIPVDHYQSCQDWAEFKANVLIDFYFSVSDFQQSVGFPDLNIQVPVASVIKGYVDMTKRGGRSYLIENTYEFFEFRPFVEKKSDFYVQPDGIYCKNQIVKGDMPEIPKSFSFTEEILVNSLKMGTTRKVYYSYDSKLIRYDTYALKNYRENAPIKIIHDFNSGVGYIIDKFIGNCTAIPLENDLDTITLEGSGGLGVAMRDPNQFFFIDNTYFYAGQRLERGITCDVYVSNRTDFESPLTDRQPSFWVFEIYFMAIGQVMESSDAEFPGAPIAIKITSSEGKIKYVMNIFDFDPVEQPNTIFDVSQCYQGKGKTEFALSFKYPEDVDALLFKSLYRRFVPKKFYEQMFSALSSYNFSPLRIIPPTLVASTNGFLIYTGLTNFAPPINHFRKLVSVRVNIANAVNKLQSSNPDNCAYECLKDSALNNNFYRCLSFDICKNTDTQVDYPTFTCAFYNSSFVTDQSLVVENEPLCDHYSKTVISIDSVSKEDAFRVVEDAILKKLFNINFENGDSFITFSADDIYTATVDAATDSTGKPPQGSTSFFKQFRLFAESYDFNIEKINQEKSIQIRERKGLSIDECARLCMLELAFRCEAVTYEPILKECKWSSMISEFFSDIDKNIYVEKKEGFFVYTREALYSYTEFPFTIASGTDLVEVKVRNENECAYKCNNEKNFKCRSFNLCDFSAEDDFKYRCLLSNSHTHDTEKDPNFIYSPICKHFSRIIIDDFKLASGYQLNVNPTVKYLNVSVERCAVICSYTEAFVCRSFDYFIDTNTCFLYKENVKDKIHINVELKPNEICNHYSREYFVENGINIEPQEIRINENRFGTGIIIFVVVLCLIIGLLIGNIVVWFGIKLIRKKADLPVISFSNPNSKF